MADQQHPQRALPAALGRRRLERSERLRGVEAPGEPRVLGEQAALLRGERLCGQLRGPARTNLGAVEHGREVLLDPRDRRSCDACLLLATRGQAPLSIRAGSVRLGLRVT
jgi:hypothetical protein